jgi:hypothetical protein
VFGRVTFSHDDIDLYVLDSVWADSSQAVTPEKTQRADERYIAANDNPAKLNLGFKFADESQCFGFNYDSYFVDDYAAHPLGSGPVTVAVDLYGSGVRATVQYVLRAGAVNHEPTIEVVEDTLQRVSRFGRRFQKRFAESGDFEDLRQA